MDNEDLKKLVLGSVSDLIADFLYYDRKNDEDLSVEDIDRAFEEKIVSVEEVVALFEKELRENTK